MKTRYPRSILLNKQQKYQGQLVRGAARRDKS
jgi:hypothetical protein